jgi:uncharacterized protein YdhG (YjbR/CyaY superfamily)
MAKTEFGSVDEYIAAQSETARGTLERVRNIIRKALPATEEAISYQIPAYRMDGGWVIYFAGWKKHFSIYPVSRLVVAELGERLAGYQMSKGTIRFALDGRVPAKLIADIARVRAREIAAMATAKAAAKGAAPRKRGK